MDDGVTRADVQQGGQPGDGSLEPIVGRTPSGSTVSIPQRRANHATTAFRSAGVP